MICQSILLKHVPKLLVLKKASQVCNQGLKTLTKILQDLSLGDQHSDNQIAKPLHYCLPNSTHTTWQNGISNVKLSLFAK